MFKLYKGYEITKRCWVKGFGILNKSEVAYKDFVFKPNIKSIAKLEEYISFCKRNEINLFFVQIPEHSSSLKYDNKYKVFEKIMVELSVKHQIPYKNFNNALTFDVNNDSYFFDSDHLNAKGAKEFSLILKKWLFYQLKLKDNEVKVL
jgi:hypothetical protein